MEEENDMKKIWLFYSFYHRKEYKESYLAHRMGKECKDYGRRGYGVEKE